MQKNIVVERSDKQFIIQSVAVGGENTGIDIGFVRTINRNLMRSYQLYMFALARGVTLVSTLQEADHVVRPGDDPQGQEQYALFYDLEPELYARTAADALDAGSEIEYYNGYELEPFIACAVDSFEELAENLKNVNCHTQREFSSAMKTHSRAIVTLESETRMTVDAANPSDLEMMMDFTDDYVLDDGKPRQEQDLPAAELADDDKLYHSFDLEFDEELKDPFVEAEEPDSAEILPFDGQHVGEQKKEQQIEQIAASIAEEMELAASAEEIEQDIVNDIAAEEAEDLGEAYEVPEEYRPKESPYWVGIDPKEYEEEQRAQEEEPAEEILADEYIFDADDQVSIEIVEEPEPRKQEPVRETSGLVLPTNVKGLSDERPAVRIEDIWIRSM